MQQNEEIENHNPTHLYVVCILYTYLCVYEPVLECISKDSVHMKETVSVDARDYQRATKKDE